jgi:hypothetical protein
MTGRLRRQHELQKKIKHTAEYDPELSDTSLAARYKCPLEFVRRTLRGEEIYPGYYITTAKRYGLGVKEVAEKMEQGQRWCAKCELWRDDREFGNTSNSSKTHRTSVCIGAKNERPGAKLRRNLQRATHTLDARDIQSSLATD